MGNGIRTRRGKGDGGWVGGGGGVGIVGYGVGAFPSLDRKYCIHATFFPELIYGYRPACTRVFLMCYLKFLCQSTE